MRRRSFLASLLTAAFKSPPLPQRYMFALTPALLYESHGAGVETERASGLVGAAQWRFLDGDISWHLRTLGKGSLTYRKGHET